MLFFYRLVMVKVNYVLSFFLLGIWVRIRMIVLFWLVMEGFCSKWGRKSRDLLLEYGNELFDVSVDTE